VAIVGGNDSDSEDRAATGIFDPSALYASGGMIIVLFDYSCCRFNNTENVV
jgi:hypothetical protein